MKIFPGFLKKVLFGLFIVLMLLMSGNYLVFAAGTELNFSPQKVKISEVGEEATVELRVKNASDLCGVDVKFKFDPSVVEVKDAYVEIGEVFSNEGDNIVIALPSENIVNNEKGTIGFSQAQAVGFSGDGVVAKITFVAKKEGSTQLNYTKNEIADSEDLFEATFKGAVLTVGGAAELDLPADQESDPEEKKPTAGEIAAEIKSVTAPAQNATRLSKPEVPTGYTIAIKTSSNTGVIALNWTITPPAAATTVNLVFEVTRTSDGSKYSTKSFPVVVPAKKDVTTGGTPTGGTTAGGTTGSQTTSSPVSTPSVSALKDMQGHWAEQAVSKLISKGIVTGYENGTYQPDAKVTRAEFVKLVVLAGGILGKQGQEPVAAFSDAGNIPAWASSFFSAAAANGLIKGDNDNRVLPGNKVTRAELAAMIVRAAGWEQEANSFNDKLGFKDNEKIPVWARGYIGVAVKHGLVSGFPDNTFRYDSQATRAEAAVMVDRLMGVLQGSQK